MNQATVSVFPPQCKQVKTIIQEKYQTHIPEHTISHIEPAPLYPSIPVRRYSFSPHSVVSPRPYFSSTLPSTKSRLSSEHVDFLEKDIVKIEEELDTNEACISFIEIEDEFSISKGPPLDLSKIKEIEEYLKE